MNTHNGTSSNHTSASSIEHRFDELRSGLEKLVDRFGAPDSYVGRVQRQIKAHPLAAIGLAFGVGYLVTRIARRR